MRHVDLERFWRDNEIALKDPFAADLPQTPLGIGMSYETVFAELGHPFSMRRLETDYEFARSAAKAYNDRAEAIVGRRLLNETEYDPSRRVPAVRSVGEIFGCRSVWQAESWWLLEAAHTPDELAKLLDRVEAMTSSDIEQAMFPPGWFEACQRVEQQRGTRPHLGRWLRGPVTLATSIYGPENLIYLILDHAALAERFRDALARVIIDYYRICDRHNDPATVRPGFGVADDNCALLTPEMYEQFGLPILQRIFAVFSPAEEDWRYQHSDSDMGHLVPLLARCGFKAVNFGPNVRFAQIRRHMPQTVVQGTLAPFTFMRNDEEGIIAEVRRDIDQARGTRGLVEATAGSINNGSLLSSLRTVMWTIQTHRP
jgi:uroporphyrinogen decarboxylase